MSDLEQDLVQLLRDFQAKVAVVVRKNALESAEAAMGAAAKRFGAGPSQVGTRKVAAQRGRSAPVAAKQPVDRDAVADQVVSYLSSNGGLRTEELGAALQVSTAALKPIVKKLVTAGRLRSEGQARGTRYFAGGGTKSRGRSAKGKAKPGRKRGKKS